MQLKCKQNIFPCPGEADTHLFLTVGKTYQVSICITDKISLYVFSDQKVWQRIIWNPEICKKQNLDDFMKAIFEDPVCEEPLVSKRK